MSILPPDVFRLYPFRSNYLDLGGPRMHYVDEGQGPVLLMLHGNPTWSFYYRDLIRSLRGRYRVIAPDHIGCGLSDKPRRYPYTLATHIENVTRLIEHLALDQITLVVHDWGGAIGFGWAVRNVSRVRRLVVFNTAAFVGPCPWRIRLCRWPIVGSVAVRGINVFAKGAIRQACRNRSRMTPAVRRGYLLPYHDYASRIAILRFVQDIPLSPRVSSWSMIQQIDALLGRLGGLPMWIGWGAGDFCFHEGYLQQWEARFPEAVVHRFEDAGHYVVEDAGDRILPLLEEFLSASTAGGKRKS